MAHGIIAKAKNWIGFPTEEYDGGEDGYESGWNPNEGYETGVELRAHSHINSPRSGATHSMTTLNPRSYNDAKEIGEAFRNGITTIVNVSALSDAEARRIIDFSTGLIFGLSGNIERVDTKVFILSPANVSVVSNSPTASNGSSEFFNQG